MEYTALPIEGVYLMEPRVFGDSRGYFMETFRSDEFRRRVADIEFVQDNESLSGRGVARGLHYQAGDNSQAKLVRVTEGRVIDIVVDLRRGSGTFGRHLMVELSEENHRMLFLPHGMAHGFVTMAERNRFVYKVDRYYAPESERTLLLTDPALGIEWPVDTVNLTLSAKDLAGVPLSELTDLF